MVQDKRRTRALNRIWQALEGGYYPSAPDLVYLSALNQEELTRFAQLWPDVPVQHRRTLLRTLVEMAENDFEMDFGALFRQGLQDEDAEVRQYALEGLWEDEDVRLIPVLVNVLRHDEVSAVRAAAAQALAHFVLLGELDKLRPEPFHIICEALLATYQDEGEAIDVRRRALEAVSYISDERVPPLIEAAYHHPDALMRQSALFAMGRSNDRRWASIVLRELYSPDPAMRYEAARACGELELRDAVHGLLEVLEDGDQEVQEVALWALGQIGGSEAKSALKRYSRSKNPALRSAAEDALDELNFLYGDTQHFFGPPERWMDYQEDTFWERPTGDKHFDDEDVDEEEWEAWAALEAELEALDTEEGEDDEPDTWDDAYDEDEDALA